MTVTSTAEEGTTFTVRIPRFLPIKDDKQDGAKATSQPPAAIDDRTCLVFGTSSISVPAAAKRVVRHKHVPLPLKDIQSVIS